LRNWSFLICLTCRSDRGDTLKLHGPRFGLSGANAATLRNFWLDKRGNQLQKRLMLWSLRSPGQKSANLDLGWATPGWNIGLMQNEYPARGVSAEIPSVAICAAVELSSLRVHVQVCVRAPHINALHQERFVANACILRTCSPSRNILRGTFQHTGAPGGQHLVSC
jgi:hypothetical protein